MFVFFLSLVFSVRENERRVCVCNDACPKVCDVFEKILIYYTPDLDAEFTKLKTKYMDIRFCHAPSPFTFRMDTFDDCEVQFDSFHLAPKAKIKVVVTRASTAEFYFNNLDVTFAGYSSSQALDIKSIQFNEVDSHNEGIAPRLITQSFEASNSVYDFKDITIKKECSDPALVIDILKGYNLELTVGEQIITLGSSTFHFEGNSTATISTQLENVKLTVNGVATKNMPYLILVGFPYTTFKGEYPPDYIMQMQNLKENTVIAEEPRLPISLDGARVNVYVSQPETVIEGDSSCDVYLFTKAKPSFRYKVRIIKLNGKIDMFSSWLDVSLDVFNPGLQIWEAPWVFCVGTGGSSTLFIQETLYSGTSPVSAFKYHTDFNVYLDDSDLRNLLQKSHEILVLGTNKTIFTAKSVSIIPIDNLEIPGFASSSNCISINIKKNQPFLVELSAVSPTTLPLKLCYSDEITDCQIDSDGFFVNSYKITDLSHCIYPGFTNVTITLKKDLHLLDFGTLIKEQKNLNIRIRSKLAKNPSLGSLLGVKSGVIQSISFTNVDIGYGQIECDAITFVGCGHDDSTDKKLNFASNTKVYADDLFLSTLNKHSSDLSQLYFTLSQYDSISVDGTEFKFTNSHSDAEPGSLEANKLASLTIHAIDTLYLNPTQISKDFTIEHSFTEKMSSNQLIFNSSIGGSSSITYNYGNYDIEIVRGPNRQIKNLNLVGTGEVSYTNDYAESASYCVQIGIDKCPKDKYDSNHIISTDDQMARLRDAPEKKILVESYSRVTIPIEYMNSKVFVFNNLYGVRTQFTLNCQNELQSPETTTIQVNNFEVTFSNLGTKKLGDIQLINCSFRSTSEVSTIKAVNLIAPYSILTNVNTLNIDGYLELYGDITFENQKTFDLSASPLVRRFRACIPDQAVVTVSENTVSIKNLKITVGHNDKGLYDVDLYTTGQTSFDFVKGDGDMSRFPKIKFSKLISSTVNFKGDWPVETNKDNLKVVFALTQYDFNLVIHSEKVPAQFDQVQMSFHITTMVPTVHIYGIFNVVSEKYHDMTIIGQDKNSKIFFDGGIGVDRNSWIKILNPIKVTVSKISSTNKNNYVGTFSFQNYVKPGENSKVTINEPLEKLDFYPAFQIYGDFTESLDSDEIQAFLQNKIDLYRINLDDVEKFQNQVKSVEFVDPLPKTHGFVGSNFEVYVQNEITADAFIRKLYDPIHTPAKACYGVSLTHDCNYILTDDNISTFPSLLPNNIEKIEIVFGVSNPHPFNLNDDKIDDVNLTITSNSSKVVTVKFEPLNGKINHLEAKNIDFEFSELTNAGYSIKSAKFTNSIANSLDGIQQIEYDFDSWTRKQPGNFAGQFLLVYPHNDITFLQDGWLIDTHEVKAADFPNLAINFTTTSYVYIKTDHDITSVHNCELIIMSNNIEVGKYWNLITSPSQIDVKPVRPLNEIIVTCQSFPFPSLPLTYGTKIRFAEDALPINTGSEVILNNQEYTIDFGLVKNSADSRLNIENAINLNGESKIYFTNSQNTSFPCQALQVVAQDGSVSSASDIYVKEKLLLNGNATLYSALDFSNAKVEIHYWKDHIPTIVNRIELTPSEVTVVYEGSKSDSGFIKDKSFPISDIGSSCQDWLRNVNYESNVKQFKGKNSKAILKCENGVLSVSGSNKISTLSAGAIAGIVIGCIAAVAIIVIVVIVIIKKKKTTGQSASLINTSLTDQ